MKEKIIQLEDLLKEITALVEKRLNVEAMTVEEYRTEILGLEEDYFSVYTEEKREAFNRIKMRLIEKFIADKKDHSFFEEDVPKIEALLSQCLTKLQGFKNESPEVRHILNKNKPNEDLIKLIRQQILNTKAAISGKLLGKIFSGFLTEDGYLELEINGTKKRFGSLRHAAIAAWGRDIQSQWKFWKVDDVPLEHFRNQIK
jgi:hypothetical protein